MRTIEQMVQQEVIYCVSTLVSNLYAQDKYCDDLAPVMSQDDWESAALEAGAVKCLDRNGYSVDGNYFDSAQEYCEERNLDPQQTEAYEHWIVSDWLADKLEAKGEMVLRDFLGLTIWGRACTGQFITMDSVIESIYNETHKTGA